MTSVAVYHKTIPNSKNQEKIDLLAYYSQGVTAAGDRVFDVQSTRYCNSDVAVIQGWVTDGFKLKPHLELRNLVIQTQLQKNRYVIAVDSNLFLYSDTANPLHYLRYSFNGIFPNTGIYCDKTIDPSRWNKISKNLGIQLKPYRTSGNHILLCLQRNGGWSMGNVDVLDWLDSTVKTLRKYTDRVIRVRPHPGDKFQRDYLIKSKIWSSLPNVSISAVKASLIDDLQNCWAAVNYNSSPVVGAAIEGYPIFVTDPARSQCQEIANTNLSQIESPNMPDRQAWVNRLAMFHWNFDELRSGECWRHMRSFM